MLDYSTCVHVADPDGFKREREMEGELMGLSCLMRGGEGRVQVGFFLDKKGTQWEQAFPDIFKLGQGVRFESSCSPLKNLCT